MSWDFELIPLPTVVVQPGEGAVPGVCEPLQPHQDTLDTLNTPQELSASGDIQAFGTNNVSPIQKTHKNHRVIWVEKEVCGYQV